MAINDQNNTIVQCRSRHSWGKKWEMMWCLTKASNYWSKAVLLKLCCALKPPGEPNSPSADVSDCPGLGKHSGLSPGQQKVLNLFRWPRYTPETCGCQDQQNDMDMFLPHLRMPPLRLERPLHESPPPT